MGKYWDNLGKMYNDIVENKCSCPDKNDCNCPKKTKTP